jgi:hypothetical protein
VVYCDREPKELTPKSAPGISIGIEVTENEDTRHYEDLLKHLCKVSGPFHRVTISGHPDPVRAEEIKAAMEFLTTSHEELRDHEECMNLQYVAFMFCLKRLGDQHLESHQYEHAYSKYVTALTLEDFWPYISPEGLYEDLRKRFRAALILNTIAAWIASGTSDFQAVRCATSRLDFESVTLLLDVFEAQMNGDEDAFLQAFSDYIAAYDPDMRRKYDGAWARNAIKAQKAMAEKKIAGKRESARQWLPECFLFFHDFVVPDLRKYLCKFGDVDTLSCGPWKHLHCPENQSSAVLL